MSSSVVQNWQKIPKLDTVCVEGSGKLAVDQHNKEHEDNILIYIKISVGWYLELDGGKVKYRLYIDVKDSKGHEFIYEAILIEHGKVKKVISFLPGFIDPDGKFWIKIPDVNADCVHDVAKYAVDKNNIDTGDELDYVRTIEGWYFEVDYVILWFWLHLEVKDCLGRPRKYKAVVKQESPNGKKIWTLLSFEKIK